MDDIQALSGIRVFDATQGVAGPHATMLLALHGADVVKLEPLEGDWCRVLGRARGQNSIESLAINRGKRSLACDLKTPAGQEIAMSMIARSDVFVESFRPGVAERLALGYEQVKKIKPDIIYMSISGFGQNGPNALRPTVDGLIQAYSGMMVMNRSSDGKPQRQGMVAVDVLTGLYAYQAVSAALIRKIRFGKGAYLDISMMQSAAAFQAARIMDHVSEKGKSPVLYAPSGTFPTADGYIVISGMRSQHFEALCQVLDRPDLATDARWPTPALRAEHSEIIHAEIRLELPKRSTAEWLTALHKAGVFAEAVLSYGQWLEQDHVKAVEAYQWIGVDDLDFGRLPVARVPGIFPCDDPNATPAPSIGEHTTRILEDLGFSSDWIQAQIASGSIRESPPLMR